MHFARLAIAAVAASVGLASTATAQGGFFANPYAQPVPGHPDEDGYKLWLRYKPIADDVRATEYRAFTGSIVIEGMDASPTLKVAGDEFKTALAGMLGGEISVATTAARRNTTGVILAGTPTSSPAIRALRLTNDLRAAGPEGYVIKSMAVGGKPSIVVAANSDVGVLYGTFALLRKMQLQRPTTALAETSTPKYQHRLLNHWDNLNRTVERGYAGLSLWAWDSLPDVRNPRYREYARANASLGINGTVLINVNSNATVMTPDYLRKVAALADEFRPYGLRVYLTARFSAPREIGGLQTADPLDPAVRAWWKAKIDEIYTYIPDFGGILVKANSEGQPGPQDYQRTHADGANMLAEPLAAHGGIVMWRAFVYSNETPTDRVRQANDEFVPLDGQFLPNVIVQVKNGALDFMPREPFHQLYGATPKTPLMVEFQITKEYLGQDTHLAYLGAYFEEVLDARTYRPNANATVATVTDGTAYGRQLSAIAGVANIGTDRDWTGSHFNQANWYAYGRLAWDHQLDSRSIAEEWVGQTFSNDAKVVGTMSHMMMASREAVVNYMNPLGLAHIMGANVHYGPAPWVNRGRADWTSVYYHKADSLKVGFDRTATGSNAVSQYAPEIAAVFGDRARVPNEYLLWFHRVGWTERLNTGRTLWDEMVHRYNEGVDSVRAFRQEFLTLQGRVDGARFQRMDEFLTIQEREAVWWRDAVLAYFQSFHRLPIPTAYPQPAHPLDYYLRLRCPGSTKSRCPGI